LAGTGRRVGIVSKSSAGNIVVMVKYDGLAVLLRGKPGGRVQLTFDEIASAVPGGLLLDV
jgi:hypothetical protein